ncbi:MAG: type II toxin-antitoxin system VapC family toxin [Pseudanabaenales cyanobacterium]|nr:type II toxin-antitoxin system VapC family toxin [Pseudanabaenales cyanobacterium]
MRVYIETTIPSYLASRPSPKVVHAGHQISAREWWENHRDRYELYTSLVTHQEAESGDADAARRRLNALNGIPMLVLTPECEVIARAILDSELMPAKADRDALHVGIATFHGMDVLLTWNIRHIANANIRHELRALIDSLGYVLPTISTPEELLPQSP